MKMLIDNNLINELKIKYSVNDEDIDKLNKILNHKTWEDLIKDPLYDKYEEMVWFCMGKLGLTFPMTFLLFFDMNKETSNNYFALVEEYKRIKNLKSFVYNDRIFYDFIKFLMEKVDFSTYNKIYDVLIGLGNTFKTYNFRWSQKAFSTAEKLEKDFETKS